MGQKMDIWLEDLQSKKQWRTGYLEENEYVSGTNRIPNFSVENYISLFQDTLQYLMNGRGVSDDFSADKIRRKLVDAEDEVMKLELSVKFQVLGSAWAAKYVFRLMPVPLDCIDIIITLKGASYGTKLTTKVNSEERDAVRFFVEGWYVVNVIVYLVPQREGEKIDVFINKGHLMVGFPISLSTAGSTSVCLGTTAYFYSKDELRVVATGAPTHVSTDLTAVKVG
ncbi:hypothetical protein PHMEG_00011765 [Phytophthora megakarya]|uniref:Uncharacterized protein n=1 Tax=Phytophthora megakarya TaxID=4795 RepID=A0A225WD07_9STRA|nr:hypothetical protein PHMEG_00011765 [Phytophthora megakarya]